jgi:hypothetical protein
VRFQGAGLGRRESMDEASALAGGH